MRTTTTTSTCGCSNARYCFLSGHVEELEECSHPWNGHTSEPLLLVQSDDILFHIGGQPSAVLDGGNQPSTQAWQVCHDSLDTCSQWIPDWFWMCISVEVLS